MQNVLKMTLQKCFDRRNFIFNPYAQKLHLYTDQQAKEQLIGKSRSEKQTSAGLTRWFDRLAHFDIAVQHNAGFN